MFRPEFTKPMPWPALFRVVRNTAFIWSTCRLAGYFVTVIAPPLPGSLAVVVLVTVLVWLQMRRFREFTLLHNLGIATTVPLTVAGLVALALEASLWSFLVAFDLWSWSPTR